MSKLWHDATPPFPDQLYHYTTPEGVLGILASKRLWATHIRYLNDPTEIDYTVNLVRTAVETRLRALEWYERDHRETELLELIGETAPSIADAWETAFVACFCEGEDAKTMWTNYGQAEGFALSFETASIESAGEPPHLLQKVIYNERSHAYWIRAAIDGVLNVVPRPERSLTDDELMWLAAAARAVIGKFAIIFKSPHFADENEWRLICHAFTTGNRLDVRLRAGRQTLIPYVEVPMGPGELMPLTEIVYGWKLDPSLTERALRWATSDLGHLKIRRSNVPYR